ncbi:hypothetical protein [Prosthecomicrobium hirschii]|uniref:hypothetical protein n=1 Tax=Prosthecodimorpha hirschii TaxID=665126 RepID=UPI00128ECB5B|nr:hypothetical protein [Prosthecomicrobium hirschii]
MLSNRDEQRFGFATTIFGVLNLRQKVNELPDQLGIQALKLARDLFGFAIGRVRFVERCLFALGHLCAVGSVGQLFRSNPVPTARLQSRIKLPLRSLYLRLVTGHDHGPERRFGPPGISISRRPGNFSRLRPFAQTLTLGLRRGLRPGRKSLQDIFHAGPHLDNKSDIKRGNISSDQRINFVTRKCTAFEKRCREPFDDPEDPSMRHEFNCREFDFTITRQKGRVILRVAKLNYDCPDRAASVTLTSRAFRYGTNEPP